MFSDFVITFPHPFSFSAQIQKEVDTSEKMIVYLRSQLEAYIAKVEKLHAKLKRQSVVGLTNIHLRTIRAHLQRVLSRWKDEWRHSHLLRRSCTLEVLETIAES